MGIREGTFEFELSKDLEFKINGASETTRRIVLNEPRMEHVKEYLKLKQLIMRSQLELAEKAPAIKKMKDSAGEVIKPLVDDVENIEAKTEETYTFYKFALESSSTVDIGQFISTFEKMICTPGKTSLASVDGRTPMTPYLWTIIDPDDGFDMAVRWCAFFGMRSERGAKNI